MIISESSESTVLSVSFLLSVSVSWKISRSGFGAFGFAFLALALDFVSFFSFLSSVFLVFLGLPGPLFGFAGSSSSFLTFLGLPGPRLGFVASLVFLFLLFGGLPGPRFLGGSCFSMIVV
ncbi:MAG: hypothetical protein SOZ23_03655 [Methanosphaera sp.]|uniref:hypothetical protein n=1 Tax=Methanosphaera sp. TaxID=2666342 RepID=UPI0025E62A28|nr:hypothetical protein [Methanosphaera sp.]MCI5867474.1 hypothetical protein [Methanosphaera sp.]MDD6534458.1 hypothetical protein [Methanosphaera sp.]MDY3955873.1 hypothetical protein [Methanosphaera sp.]